MDEKSQLIMLRNLLVEVVVFNVVAVEEEVSFFVWLIQCSIQLKFEGKIQEKVNK